MDVDSVVVVTQTLPKVSWSLRDAHGLTRTVYQVDASHLCRLVEDNERRAICSSFGQFLRLASRDQQKLLTNEPDLISVAIDWNPARCTTSNVEDLLSIIDPFLHLRELFDQVRTEKRLNLIGLICFYGGTLEVFFSYEPSTSQWLFSFDGHVTRLHDWPAVIGKCTDCHLQPFLLIYANTDKSSINISQLLRSTTMTRTNQGHPFANLAKISWFGTMNSSMLFPLRVPSTANDGYINPSTVVRVMQQQLRRKESLLSDDADSGVGSAINDGSSDESLVDHSMPSQFDRLLTTVEYHWEQSVKSESAREYASAVNSCQYALTLIDQILDHHPPSNHGQAIYVRTKKNSLLLRLRSLKAGDRSTRPKKTVKFSDQIALIVPIRDEHAASDSDSESSIDEMPIGLTECSLCHKRCSKTNQIGPFCANCHFYMQRFQPSRP